MPRPWLSIGCCPTESFDWARRLRWHFLCGCTTHGVKSGCDSSQNDFSPPPQKKKWLPRTRLSFFYFWFQVLLLYGSTCVHSTHLWILREGEKQVPGRSCTSTISAANHYTQLCRFSWRNRSLETVQGQKKKKEKEPVALQYLSNLYIKHEAA